MRVRGHRDDRGPPGAVSRRRGSRGRLVAVHLGHLAVHQHGVVRRRGPAPRAPRGRSRRRRAVARACRACRCGDQLVDRVVLGHEHARAGAARRRRGQGLGAAARAAGARRARSRRARAGCAAHRLRQAGRDPAARASLGGRRTPEREQHQRRVAAAPASRADRPRELDAVHAGHAVVEDRQRVRRPVAGRRVAAAAAPAGPPRRTSSRACPSAPSCSDRIAGWSRCRRRRARAGRRAARRATAPRRRGRRRRLERHREAERAALAGLAVDPMSPPISVDELPRDRQPEPGAAEPAGGRAVGLREGLEQRGDALGRDADAGVGDLERAPARGRRSRSSTLDADRRPRRAA